jgi:hypothetical protein
MQVGLIYGIIRRSWFFSPGGRVAQSFVATQKIPTWKLTLNADEDGDRLALTAWKTNGHIDKQMASPEYLWTS